MNKYEETLRTGVTVISVAMLLLNVLIIWQAPLVSAANTNPPCDTCNGSPAGDGVNETIPALGEWRITSPDEPYYKDVILIVHGDLVIESGKLTLDNVTMIMNKVTGSDPGNLIEVQQNGELIIKGGSTITTTPHNASFTADPYAFKIQSGSALTLQDSTVEKMYDNPGSEVDGVELYSSSVTIENSTVGSGDGHGCVILLLL